MERTQAQREGQRGVGERPCSSREHSSLSVNQLTFLPPPTIYLEGPAAATKSADLRQRKEEGDRRVGGFFPALSKRKS